LDIVLALVAALLFALGTVLQQKAGIDEPSDGASTSLLLRMARRPVWLAGIAADAGGFLAQAAALGVGRLAVVQPLLVCAVVFALPLGARLTGQRVRRLDVAAACLVVVSLVVFLAAASPSGGRENAPLGDWLLAGGACAAVCAPLVALGQRGPAPRRAALLGVATGVLFALSAALTKSVVDELGGGPLEVITGWHLYALAAVGYASMTLNQLALNTGALAPAIASSNSLDPIVSIVLGVTLFDEVLNSSAPEVAATVVSILAAVAGMVILARSQSEAQSAPAAVSTPGTA
jgi:drug/metabolite transporter (DMT)-like permease